MWKVKVLDIKSNKVFEKELPSHEFYAFKRKCSHSKKVMIISELKVW